MTSTVSDFKTAAHTTFENLKGVFEKNKNYWQLGHSFDTIIDYFVTNPADAKGFAEIALGRYYASNGNWYDDYGWWGIAGLKASLSDLFGNSTSQFQKIADCCWNTMDANAPRVWERADKNKYGLLQPRFDGGVWNSDWSTGCNPLTEGDTLCGYQNTVTNGLYLVLAARQYIATKAPLYLKAADREYSFLNQWFNVSGKSLTLLNRYVEGKAVVRERVSGYASPEPVYHYRHDLAWAGDQGLILGGLVDMMRIPKSIFPYRELLSYAQLITAGVKDRLVDKDGILLSWKPDPAPGDDSGDYNTGIGVYMRYLLYAYQNNDDLKKYLQDTGYREFCIKRSGAAIGPG